MSQSHESDDTKRVIATSVRTILFIFTLFLMVFETWTEQFFPWYIPLKSISGNILPMSVTDLLVSLVVYYLVGRFYKRRGVTMLSVTSRGHQYAPYQISKRAQTVRIITLFITAFVLMAVSLLLFDVLGSEGLDRMSS